MSGKSVSIYRLVRTCLEQACAEGAVANLFVTRAPSPPARAAARPAARPAIVPAPLELRDAPKAPPKAATAPPPARSNAAPPAFVPPPGSTQAQLDALRAHIGDCRLCPVLVRNRRNIVFGSGNVNASIVFVGEAPGQDEDEQGLPFVGKAGQLLTQIIEKGMGIPRSEVYIANILKCRPPNNREPLPDEIEHCTQFLNAQLAIIKPKVIVALGAYSAHFLTGTKTPITKLRGNWCTYRDIAVMPTFHPSYLLRNYTPESRRLVWEDVKEAMARISG